MGTRADFYVGRGKDAEWLGSTGMDGYPDGIPETILAAASERIFRRLVGEYLDADKYSTKPEQGWPWPWDDSATTDYAYAFDGGRTWTSYFGHRWYDALERMAMSEADLGRAEEVDDRNGKSASFPDMKARKAVTFGKRSGLLVFGIK